MKAKDFVPGLMLPDNPKAAENWVNTVFEKVGKLKAFSEGGRIVPEINNKAIRELTCGDYQILCRLEKERISVLAVRHGKQVLSVDEITAQGANNKVLLEPVQKQ